MPETMPQSPEKETNLESEITALQQEIIGLVNEQVEKALNYKNDPEGPQWERNEYQKKVKSKLEKVNEAAKKGIMGMTDL